MELYVLHGGGGDGGVEAFATLADGKVFGLQAKWFRGNLDDGRARQIRKSINRARATYANLCRYVVALPSNLTASGSTRKPPKGRSSRGGVDRWASLIDWSRENHPGLEIDRWDEAGLLNQLADGNDGLRALWFRGTFVGLDELRHAWTRVRERLRDRYLPDLHATGEIERALAVDLFEPEHTERLARTAQAAERRFQAAWRRINDLRHHLTSKGDLSLDDELGAAMVDLQALLNHADELIHSARRGPLGNLSTFPNVHDIKQLANHLEALHQRSYGWRVSDLARDSVWRAVEGIEGMRLVHHAWVNARRPRMVLGPPGCGKTHASAHLVEQLLAAGNPAVCIDARFVRPSRGLAIALCDVLDRPGWSLGQLLDALESAAVLSQCAEQRTGGWGFKRALLVLDGLEESSGWDAWAPVLDDLAVECRLRPRLHLLVSMRPETAERLTPPSTFIVQRLNDDAGVSLPEMFARYCRHYRVEAAAVPWLGGTIRSPLEVRLVAEEFQGRALTHDDGIQANLIGLFRRKLDRIEIEARRRAGSLRWSDGLGLLPRVLSSLVNLTARATSPFVEDQEVIRDVKSVDSEFSADRVRFALASLVSYGLVDERQPLSRGLVRPPKRYGVASRHLSDFVVAEHAAKTALATLRSGQRTIYPLALNSRPGSAALFAAVLAEEGWFVTDDIWTEVAPEHTQLDMLAALALIPPSVASSRRAWVKSVLKGSTKSNREAVSRVVLRVARIPGHPLGPLVLDAALRSLPLADRDPVWSVPDTLAGTGPWQGSAVTVLDEVTLDPAADEWNGRPLIVAWTCSSVVEPRRRRAREQLAVWGASRLGEMAQLLDHMAQVDDPQVVEDLTVAALGAAMGARFDDPALLLLARTVDRLYFAPDAKAWTSDVIVRRAARGVIERAALLHPSKVDEFVERARPPYQARGPRWPDIDLNEIRQHGTLGGEIVTGDLSWYVAERCFSPFLEEAREETEQPAVTADPLNNVDEAILKAAATGALAASSEIARHCQTVLNERERTSVPSMLDDDVIDQLRWVYAERHPPSAETAEPNERELLRWARREVFSDRRRGANRRPSWSVEFNKLRRHAAGLTGTSNVSIDGIRNALISSHVRRWGWSKAGFSEFDRDKPPHTVDVAIVRQHRQATHGQRSQVASFREKYVWAAVNRVAGDLADRLPVWNRESHQWIRGQHPRLGTGMPDPLPRSAIQQIGRETERQVWFPDGLWPDLFSDEPALARRAERWLVEAPLPDPRLFVRGQAETWSDGALLAANLFRQGHQACIDQAVWVACLGVPLDVAHLLKRDTPFLKEDRLHETFGWVADEIYVSPALGCWAPWLSQDRDRDWYVTLNEQGQPARVFRHPLVTQVTARDEEEHSEPHAWFPGPTLRSALGIVGAAGDRRLRYYLDRDRNPMAIERSLSQDQFAFSHHYLAIEWRRLLDGCRAAGLVPVWAVRLWREATPALWIEGDHRVRLAGLDHRSRDVSWLLIWNEQTQELDVVSRTDDLAVWTGESGDHAQ